MNATFILQSFGLKLCQCVPMALNINIKLTCHANLHICIINKQYAKADNEHILPIFLIKFIKWQQQ